MVSVKPPDIFDVARKANVSTATVSRALNHPEVVRINTRNRIMEAIEEVGYIPNRAARAMHQNRSGTIGLLVPTIDNSIFSHLIQAFSETLNELDFTMLISTNGYDLDQENSQLRNMLEHRVDAIALVGLEHTNRSYRLIEGRRTPAVAIWNYDEASLISCVGADNREAGKIAAEHIVGLGHQKIATMFPPVTGNDRARFRQEGVWDVLNKNGITITDFWRVTTKYDVSQAQSLCRVLLDNPDRPTAIIAGNDIIARGAISAASQLGLPVPAALSVIGIGDFAESAEWIPPLTTVNMNADQIGQTAARMLVKFVHGGGDQQPVRKLVASRLVVRNSTSSPAV